MRDCIVRMHLHTHLHIRPLLVDYWFLTRGLPQKVVISVVPGEGGGGGGGGARVTS